MYFPLNMEKLMTDIALCPMEACKVRIQTQPGWSSTLREGFPRILNEDTSKNNNGIIMT
jgi:hypothetical protein